VGQPRYLHRVTGNGDTFNILLDGDLYGGTLSRFAYSLTLPKDWEFTVNNQNGDTGVLCYTGSSAAPVSAGAVTAPEPGTLSLIGMIGLPVLYVLRRRKQIA